MKTPQVKPDWKTGIYIGNGVVAVPTADQKVQAVVDSINCVMEGIGVDEGDNQEAMLHELAWQLVNVTRGEENDV